jgi:hypothetical protein
VRSATFLALALLSFGVAPIACTQDFNFFQATGGGSAGTGCKTNTDCNDMNPCTTDACNTATGTCSHTPINGAVPGNVPMTNVCVTNSCSNGMLVTNDATVGTSCGTNQTCDGAGNCVGCMKSSDCMNPGVCKTVTCDMTSNTCKVSDSNVGTACSSGGGRVCDGAGNCVACVMNSDCGGGTCQNNMCTGGGNGQPCQMGSDCTSGHCVTGVCCNHSCGGTCMGCTAALTGSQDGVCGTVQQGSPAPAGQCTQAACGNTGNCDGAGGCEQAMAGSVCAAAMCVGNVWHSQQTCTFMNCGGGTTQDCMTYMCAASGCPTSCTSDAQCSTGNYCAAIACTAKLPSGSPCTGGNQCKSGSCNPGQMRCQ